MPTLDGQIVLIKGGFIMILEKQRSKPEQFVC